MQTHRVFSLACVTVCFALKLKVDSFPSTHHLGVQLCSGTAMLRKLAVNYAQGGPTVHELGVSRGYLCL